MATERTDLYPLTIGEGSVDWVETLNTNALMASEAFNSPLGLPYYASASALPPGADWDRCIAYLPGESGPPVERFVINVGGVWYKANSSATVVTGTGPRRGRSCPAIELPLIPPNHPRWAAVINAAFQHMAHCLTNPWPIPVIGRTGLAHPVSAFFRLAWADDAVPSPVQRQKLRVAVWDLSAANARWMEFGPSNADLNPRPTSWATNPSTACYTPLEWQGLSGPYDYSAISWGASINAFFAGWNRLWEHGMPLFTCEKSDLVGGGAAYPANKFKYCLALCPVDASGLFVGSLSFAGQAFISDGTNWKKLSDDSTLV